jgi:hypothetical protein
MPARTLWVTVQKSSNTVSARSTAARCSVATADAQPAVRIAHELDVNVAVEAVHVARRLPQAEEEAGREAVTDRGPEHPGRVRSRVLPERRRLVEPQRRVLLFVEVHPKPEPVLVAKLHVELRNDG